MRRIKAFALSAMAITIAACGSGQSTTSAKYLDTLVVGDGAGDPGVLCSCVQSGRAVALVSTQLFAGLVQVPESLSKPEPYLAKSWTTSSDGLTWTLHLQPGAEFSDGTAITSADVAFSIATVKQYHGFGPKMFNVVTSVDTSDPATAVIHLAHPDQALLTAMTPPLLPIIPQHIYGNVSNLPADPRFTSNVVGSGPYELVSYTINSKVVMKPNPHFFLTAWHRVSQLVYEEFTSETTMAVAMSSGEIQLADFESPSVVAHLKTEKSVQVSPTGGEALGGINWMEFNTKNPILQNVLVRRAIAYATNVNAIIQNLQGGVTKPALGPIAPGVDGYNASADATYPYDPTKAGQLLDQAGYTMQASGSRFGLTLDVNPDNPPEYSTLLGQLLKSQLAQVGIQITLNVFPDGATAFTTVSNYNYDIFINDVFNWGDPTIGVARTYACDNIRKGVMFADMSQYCNPQLDAIEASAASATDANQAQSDWNQYQHLLTQDVPIRWLSTESFHVVASAGLANLPTGAWGDMAPMYNLATTR